MTEVSSCRPNAAGAMPTVAGTSFWVRALRVSGSSCCLAKASLSSLLIGKVSRGCDGHSKGGTLSASQRRGSSWRSGKNRETYRHRQKKSPTTRLFSELLALFASRLTSRDFSPVIPSQIPCYCANIPGYWRIFSLLFLRHFQTGGCQDEPAGYPGATPEPAPLPAPGCLDLFSAR
jgi:hypothetical protein